MGCIAPSNGFDTSPAALKTVSRAADGTIINPRPQRRLWRRFKWNLKRGSWLICRHVLFLLMVFWFSQDDLSGTLVRVGSRPPPPLLNIAIYIRASPNDDHKPGPTPHPHNFYIGNFRKAFSASQAFYNIRDLLAFYYDHWMPDSDVGSQIACERKSGWIWMLHFRVKYCGWMSKFINTDEVIAFSQGRVLLIHSQFVK